MLLIRMFFAKSVVHTSKRSELVALCLKTRSHVVHGTHPQRSQAKRSLARQDFHKALATCFPSQWNAGVTVKEPPMTGGCVYPIPVCHVEG